MRLIGIIGVLGLAACSPAALVETAFPDREIFEFRTTDGVSVVSYACAPGASASETQARASEAHQFTERNIEAAAEVFANQIVNSAENGQSALGASFGAARGLNANAERIVEAAEERYQCLLFDERAA